MDFAELIKKRESVRGYISKEVENEKIIKVIEAARLAPSACNAQPWKFVVVNEPEKVKALSRCLYDPLVSNINKFALTAPVFIVVVDERRNITSKLGEIFKNQDFTSVDIGIACEHICLQARELNLGTCMMGWFRQGKVKKLLNIPKSKKVHLVISLGYYDMKEPRKKIRKNIDEILTFNEYR